ncbi:MAG: hypothetical protein RL319_60 [Actinomycetota bacterium]|jgi:cytoplasmic iron level regulating protein YaaA (DUF328/UPF0246 family)
MLFLLPPSETKAKKPYPGAAENSLSVSQVALAFGSLGQARAKVAKLAADQKIFKAPTMMAIDRYTGTLYGAVHGRGLKGTPTEFAHLSESAMARAKEIVLIQSALFGLIPATALIPDYKFSATPKLKTIWVEPHQVVFRRLNGIIIDMRSKQYGALAPIPEDLESYFLDVVLEAADGTRSSMNHFNKKSKGELIHAVLNSKVLPKTISDLRKIAKKAGFGLEQSGRELTLIVAHA